MMGLEDDQLTMDPQQQELLRQLYEPIDVQPSYSLLEGLTLLGTNAEAMMKQLQELEASLEAYEETLIPNGHHPVHCEKISEIGDEE